MSPSLRTNPVANVEHILWIKTGPLLPLDTGGKIRTHAMLDALSKRIAVTYLALKDPDNPLHPDEQEAPYAHRKLWIPWKETPKRSPRFFLELLANALTSSRPYALAKYHSPALEEQIHGLDLCGRFDLIVCDFLAPALNVPTRSLKTPAILFQHNIEADIWSRLADAETRPLAKGYLRSQARRMERSERELSSAFPGLITVSENDAEISRARYGLDNVLGAVPTGVDVEFFAPDPARPGPDALPPRIAFLGSMDWLPNIDCVQYYAKEVLPTLLQEQPDLKFVVIGRSPTPAIRELAQANPAIELTGTVDDVRPHLQACHHMVVPLRAGGGTRIKIFEAMAQGVPVVSTTIGAEGLPVEHERDLLLADTSEELARASLRLLGDPGLTSRLQRQARDKMIQEHSWETVAGQFLDLCHNLPHPELPPS